MFAFSARFADIAAAQKHTLRYVSVSLLSAELIYAIQHVVTTRTQSRHSERSKSLQVISYVNRSVHSYLYNGDYAMLALDIGAAPLACQMFIAGTVSDRFVTLVRAAEK